MENLMSDWESESSSTLFCRQLAVIDWSFMLRLPRPPLRPKFFRNVSCYGYTVDQVDVFEDVDVVVCKTRNEKKMFGKIYRDAAHVRFVMKNCVSGLEKPVVVRRVFNDVNGTYHALHRYVWYNPKWSVPRALIMQREEPVSFVCWPGEHYTEHHFECSVCLDDGCDAMWRHMCTHLTCLTCTATLWNDPKSSCPVCRRKDVLSGVGACVSRDLYSKFADVSDAVVDTGGCVTYAFDVKPDKWTYQTFQNSPFVFVREPGLSRNFNDDALVFCSRLKPWLPVISTVYVEFQSDFFVNSVMKILAQ